MSLRIPYYRQQAPYTCGPAVLRMALSAMGKRRSEAYLARLAETTAREGTSNFGLLRCLRKLNIEYMTWYRGSYRDIQLNVKNGIVIIDWMPQLIFPEHPEFRPSREFNPDEDAHYALIVSAGEKFVTLQDPALGRRLRVSRASFLKAWRDPLSTSNHWMLVVLHHEEHLE
ncbi:peptidase C39 family protein [Candidatus Woesearchaeota archaeon]|nr:peptidase C39 family protein [Candidatus Woesearchaeota archaeon]